MSNARESQIYSESDHDSFCSSSSFSETSGSSDSSSSPESEIEFTQGRQTELLGSSPRSISSAARRARIIRASRVHRRRESAPASPPSGRRISRRRERILRASRVRRRRESAPASSISGRREPEILVRIRRRREQRRRRSADLNSAPVTSGHQSGSSDSDEDVVPPSDRRHASLGLCLYRVATGEITPVNDGVIKAINVKAISCQDSANVYEYVCRHCSKSRQLQHGSVCNQSAR